MNYNFRALGIPVGAWAEQLRFTYAFIDNGGLPTAKDILSHMQARGLPSGFGLCDYFILDPREEIKRVSGLSSYRDSVVIDLREKGIVLVVAYSLPLQKQSK
jgi:hypothetical protein